MNNTYRGFELSAKREKSLGGDTLLYYYIKRNADGWFMEDAFTSGTETPKEYMSYLKAQVDEYYTNPLERYNDYETYDYVVKEMSYTFTPAEIGAHFQRYAESLASKQVDAGVQLPTSIDEGE